MTDKERPAKKRHTATTRPDCVAAVARRAEALRLRVNGATFAEIGAALSIDPATAHRDICRGLAALHEEIRAEAADLLALEAARLDALHMAHWEAALAGIASAADVVLRVMHHRARLFGLYAPAKIAPTDPTGENPYTKMTDDELREAARQVLGLADETATEGD